MDEVVHSDNGNLIRNGDAEPDTGAQNLLANAVVGGEDATGLRQCLQPALKLLRGAGDVGMRTGEAVEALAGDGYAAGEGVAALAAP